jgi:chromatin segregation and condensation protein Rec8/ScpA/Scc1 (kleisin family)
VLELYKEGELTWTQDAPFEQIRIEARPPAAGGSRDGPLARLSA